MKPTVRAMPRIAAAAVSCAAVLAPSAVSASAPGLPMLSAGTAAVTVYVANNTSDTVTPIPAATNKPGKPIPVHGRPTAIAITPNGKTAYVISDADENSGYVTAVSTATNTAVRAISVPGDPTAIAITPDGATAYVAVSSPT